MARPVDQAVEDLTAEITDCITVIDGVTVFLNTGIDALIDAQFGPNDTRANELKASIKTHKEALLAAFVARTAEAPPVP